MPFTPDEAAAVIQRRFRQLGNVTTILNGHEKELRLDQISKKDREQFIQELKHKQFNKIVYRENLTQLALSARRVNLVSESELFMMLELAEMVREFGPENIVVHNILNDEQSNFSSAGLCYFEYLFTR